MNKITKSLFELALNEEAGNVRSQLLQAANYIQTLESEKLELQNQLWVSKQSNNLLKHAVKDNYAYL